MASYNYPKASTLATRTLISGDDKPIATPSSASHDHDGAHDKAILQSTPSNNYAEAVAAAETGRPGLDRQQSWNRQDLKREQHEQMINSGGKGAGYMSTGKQ